MVCFVIVIYNHYKYNIIFSKTIKTINFRRTENIVFFPWKVFWEN
jgi:hypothetical protein